MDSFNDVWSSVLDLIKERISDTSFRSWIQPLKPVRFEGEEAFLFAQSNFQKKIVDEKFRRDLETALFEVMGFDVKINLLTEENVRPKLTDQKKMKNYTELLPEDEEEFTPTYDSELTFDNFVVGNENKFAHAAALAVANNPAGAYNPFFIYGKSGLGKTHLLCAIANEIKRNNPRATIMMVKGEEFMNELITSIKSGEQLEFRNKYRYVDVFLVDDVQFIGGKTSTELEFFHTFETLYEAKKQIIVTSDRPPKDMPTLEDRLKTRFEQGLIADIQPPEYETRVAIIKRKADSLKLELTEDIISYIASKLKNNVRELEGAVKKIKAYSLIFLGQTPTIGIIQNVIQSVIKENINTTVTPDKIVEHVSRFYGVPTEEIYGSKRIAKIKDARQISMYIIREMTEMSLSMIGDEFGGKNHTTVLHSANEVARKMETDPKFAQTIQELIENIKKDF